MQERHRSRVLVCRQTEGCEQCYWGRSRKVYWKSLGQRVLLLVVLASMSYDVTWIVGTEGISVNVIVFHSPKIGARTCPLSSS